MSVSASQAINPEHQYFWEQIRTLFSAVMVIDEDLRISYASETVMRAMPLLADSPRLLDAFAIQRPGRISSFGDAAAKVGALFLLIAKDGSFALRGQVIHYENAGKAFLIFCGAPWLFWLTTNRPELKLGLSDFSAQDVQLDQMFYMSTEKRMVDDLERLNGELQQANQQVQQAQQEKSAFFAQMSHEMRTPLNGVVSALALLAEKQLPDAASELLRLARVSSRNLMEVINYVLDVAKIESASSTAQSSAFNLPELIDSTLDVLSARAMEKGIALRTKLHPGLSRFYHGDPERLRQALLNLTVNGIKFTEQGSVTVEAFPAQDNPEMLRIEVNDTGIGISRDDQARIFQPFVSLKPKSGDGASAGTGLGLDIVRRHVESMGGRVGVSSAPGSGSCFWLSLPLAPAAEAALSTDKKPADRQRAVPALDAHILLVDDNETNLMLGGMILESLGLAVTTAGSGEQALEILQQSIPDLVLMDINMPGMDGYETTRRIRATHDSQTLPVVALTAYASTEEVANSEQAGMDGYLTKPIESATLMEKLASLLPHRAVKPAEKTASDFREEDIDRESLQLLRQQIGAENLTMVIEKFGEEARRRWQTLAAQDDFASRAREAHTLASTCRSFGLPTLADTLGAMEERAKLHQAEDLVLVEATGQRLLQALVALEKTVTTL